MYKEIYYKYFDEKIKRQIIPYELERKRTVRKVVINSTIMFICGILCAYAFILFSLNNSAILLLLPIILFLMYVFFIKSITNVIFEGKKFQNSLVENILPMFFEPIANFTNWPKNHDISTFLSSELFPNFETREDERAFFGIYKNVNITISNTKLTIPPNKIVFKGITIQLELNKSINNHVVLISKNEYKFNSYRQINPHVNDLNKYLYTFSKNENTSFITENFWNCLKHIGEAYTAKGFGFSYKDSTVLIALKQKNPFQFGFLFKSLLISKNYDELINMFSSIFELIDIIS